eukprot:1350103-Prymnesium_polylepis.1
MGSGTVEIVTTNRWSCGGETGRRMAWPMVALGWRACGCAVRTACVRRQAVFFLGARSLRTTRTRNAMA